MVSMQKQLQLYEQSKTIYWVEIAPKKSAGIRKIGDKKIFLSCT